MSAKENQKQAPFQKKGWKNWLILAGVLVVVAAVFVVKNQSSPVDVAANLSAEEQLDIYLEEEEPIFLFFHSDNCHSCIVMMDIVDEVFPEFKDRVKMVDVNVYDPLNEDLLRQAQIYSIPTQIFIDQEAKGKVAMGVMSAEELREQLQILAGGE